MTASRRAGLRLAELGERGRSARADLYPPLTDHEIEDLVAGMWTARPRRAGNFEIDAVTGNRLCVTLDQLLGARLALQLGFGQPDRAEGRP